MGVDMSIEGLDSVLDMLKSMESKEIIKAARSGLQDGLQDIRGEARMLCPRDTGELARSIKTRTRMGSDELTGEVYSASEYAIYVEMGTGPKGETNHAGVNPEWAANVTYSPKGWVYPTKDGELRYTEGMPARPYLYPAFKANQGKVYRKIANAVIRHVGG